MENNKTNAVRHSLTNRRGLIIGAAAVILVAIAIFGWSFALKGAPAQAYIRIPANATNKTLTDTLAKYFGADYAAKVMRFASLSDEEMARRHGMYLIEQDTPAVKVARRLTKGAQQPVKITINGFRSRNEMARRIAAKLDFTAEELLAAMQNPEIIGKYGLTPESSPALFLDDTYELYWSASPEEFIKKIGSNYEKFWNTERRAKAEALALTPEQVMIIASIVDEESNKTDEKGRIGRLYINRLNKGMRLQADPTVRFALNDFTIRRVSGAHLQVDSPYNTYRIKGLPPGPIRTTGKRTVDAILNSEPSSDLYMCARADFSGYHDFAATYDEHLKNAARYQEELNRRGIK